MSSEVLSLSGDSVRAFSLNPQPMSEPLCKSKNPKLTGVTKSLFKNYVVHRRAAESPIKGLLKTLAEAPPRSVPASRQELMPKRHQRNFRRADFLCQ